MWFQQKSTQKIVNLEEKTSKSNFLNSVRILVQKTQKTCFLSKFCHFLKIHTKTRFLGHIVNFFTVFPQNKTKKLCVLGSNKFLKDLKYHNMHYKCSWRWKYSKNYHFNWHTTELWDLVEFNEFLLCRANVSFGCFHRILTLSQKDQNS